jgi:hypothetical protein
MADNGDHEVMKSALEIALEKTRGIAPSEDPRMLTVEEKARVREINREFGAKIAEIEIQVSQRIRQMAGKFGEQEIQEHMQSFQQELRGERNRINAERQEVLKEFHTSIGK